MTRIGVTGGAGFVGTNLVRALLQNGFEVSILDDFTTGMKSNLANLDSKVYEGSITDMKLVAKAFSDCEYIFHLAARGSVPRSIRNPRATMDVNLWGTLNVLETARNSGATVAFSSSSSVYGSNLELPKNERMWMAPITPYAASKLAGEALVASYAASFGVSAVTYRFFNIFGPWQRPDHAYAAVIPKWIWNLMQSKEIEVFGDGSQSRDFTFIDTVVSVLIQGMKDKVNHPNPINLAHGFRISLNQCIDALRIKFPKLQVRYLPERAGDVRDSQNDPTLFKSIFPLIKPLDFSEALDNTCQWFFDHGSTIANGPRVID